MIQVAYFLISWICINSHLYLDTSMKWKHITRLWLFLSYLLFWLTAPLCLSICGNDQTWTVTSLYVIGLINTARCVIFKSIWLCCAILLKIKSIWEIIGFMKNFQVPLSLVALLVFLTVIVDFMSKLSEEDVQVVGAEGHSDTLNVLWIIYFVYIYL